MPKLHLKRTPEEEAARRLRKQKKNETKGKKKGGASDNSFPKRRRTEKGTRWASSDDEPLEAEYNPKPLSPSPTASTNRSIKPDYEHIRAELEEQQFREKMFEALEDDERLDSLETHFNDFAHVPGRWRPSKRSKQMYGDEDSVDNNLNLDPRHMDEEEYVEWIRVGMYRRKHAEEYAEQQRERALKAEHRAKENARRLETLRLEKLAEEEQKRRKLEREDRRRQRAKQAYELRWKELLSCQTKCDLGDSEGELTFYDIPWPTLASYHHKLDHRDPTVDRTLQLQHLTKEAIADFLIPPPSKIQDTEQKEQKERKDKLRETFLRYHPDKFEGRFMKLVKENQREAVREAIGQVVRSLNALLSDTS